VAAGSGPETPDTIRCVALLTLVANRLELGGERPIDLIDAVIDQARDLPEDAFGCASACNDAADTLSEWLNSGYDH
jgi:hypothetical protein